MPNYIGRNLLIKRGSSVIASVRTKTISIKGTGVDITTDDSNGYQTYLEDPSVRSIDLSVEGLTEDDDLRAAILSGSGSLLLDDISVEYPDGATLTCDFFFSSLEETGQHTDAVAFTASMQSSGQWTYTSA